MKKMLLASAFALIGTFVMANETNITTVVEKECDLFKSSTECGGYIMACKDKDATWDLAAINEADKKLCEMEKLIESIPPAN